MSGIQQVWVSCWSRPALGPLNDCSQIIHMLAGIHGATVLSGMSPSSTFSWWCWLAVGRTEKLNSCWIPLCAAAHIWVFKGLLSCDFRGHGSLWKCPKAGIPSTAVKKLDKSKQVIKSARTSIFPVMGLILRRSESLKIESEHMQ